jgi:hypothetical protein
MTKAAAIRLLRILILMVDLLERYRRELETSAHLNRSSPDGASE